MPTLKIKDADGNDAYLEMQSGDGSSGSPFVPKQQVDVGNFPADQVVTPSSVGVTMGGASITTDDNQYTGKRWVRVTNTHASVDVVVTIGSSTKTVGVGETYETPLLGRGESLPTVEVDAAASSADVEFLNV